MAAENKVGGVIYFLCSVVAGIAAGYFGHDLVHDNADSVVVVVTLFSILAGFIVAVATVVGDPAFLANFSWKAHVLFRDTIAARIAAQKYLFYFYLATLGAVFVSTLLRKHVGKATEVFDGVYLGLAVTSFLLSLRLPEVLAQMQRERHDEAIKDKRKEAGIQEP